eukprot:1140361-Pelagomonas_calceolata.AAC.1
MMWGRGLRAGMIEVKKQTSAEQSPTPLRPSLLGPIQGTCTALRAQMLPLAQEVQIASQRVLYKDQNLNVFNHSHKPQQPFACKHNTLSARAATQNLYT